MLDGQHTYLRHWSSFKFGLAVLFRSALGLCLDLRVTLASWNEDAGHLDFVAHVVLQFNFSG